MTRAIWHSFIPLLPVLSVARQRTMGSRRTHYAQIPSLHRTRKSTVLLRSLHRLLGLAVLTLAEGRGELPVHQAEHAMI